MAACPFGALSDTSKMVDVIEAIKSGEELWAVFAPSIEGQFGPQITIPMIKDALLRAGFAHVQEVAVGADAVAQHEAEELLENKKLGRKMTTSCCPAFVNLIEKHYPTLAPLISHTVSPMQAIGRYIKKPGQGRQGGVPRPLYCQKRGGGPLPGGCRLCADL